MRIPGHRGADRSFHPCRDAVDGLVKVLLKSRLSLVSALFSVAQRQDKKYEQRRAFPPPPGPSLFRVHASELTMRPGARRSWSVRW
jgi:hypothetical protein